MIYYLEEQYGEECKKNAFSKARMDMTSILRELGGTPLEVMSGKKTGLRKHLANAAAIAEALDDLLKADDSVIVAIQFPLLYLNTIFMGRLIRRYQKKGVVFIVVLHDLISMRRLKNEPMRISLLNWLTEKPILKHTSHLIVHNAKMKKLLTDSGVNHSHIHQLEIFDYLHETEHIQKSMELSETYEICVAGNLVRQKAGYIYELPENVQFRLYGTGFEETHKSSNISYMGSYYPEELLDVLQGHFGLVWDGPNAQTCEGSHGEYLRYNNPHKTSLYLSCGIPVIIWEQAALAPFILEHHVGFTVSSLYEIADKVRELSDEEYQMMKRNALELSEKLRHGYFTKKVLKEILEQKGL